MAPGEWIYKCPCWSALRPPQPGCLTPPSPGQQSLPRKPDHTDGALWPTHCVRISKWTFKRPRETVANKLGKIKEKVLSSRMVSELLQDEGEGDVEGNEETEGRRAGRQERSSVGRGKAVGFLGLSYLRRVNSRRWGVVTPGLSCVLMHAGKAALNQDSLAFLMHSALLP